jgi:UDP-2,3-diacylglucosamine pyrophosphatase LpxH
MTIVWRGIAIYISHIKLGRFKQLRKVMRKEECMFVTGFHRQYMTVFMNQNIHFLLIKLYYA